MTAGGPAYCNEPLRLPVDWTVGDRVFVARRPPGIETAAPQWDDDPTVEQLAWFRWITGHQTCFILWRLAGMSLLRILNDQEGRSCDADASDAAALLRASAAMADYAGSCGREVYERLIRPIMALWHPAFTGKWSTDYQPLPNLVRQAARSPALDRSSASQLSAAFRGYLRVHGAVALRLVPDGTSLLQQSKGLGFGEPWGDAGHRLYDSFFIITRECVSDDDLVEACDRRAAMIAADLDRTDARGRTPDSTSRGFAIFREELDSTTVRRSLDSAGARVGAARFVAATAR